MGGGSHRYVKSDNGSEQVYCECLKGIWSYGNALPRIRHSQVSGNAFYIVMAASAYRRLDDANAAASFRA